MSNPNPLIPQGTFQSQAGKGASNIRIAVATIVAIHVVFFGGLLLQGCQRENKTASNSAAEPTSTVSSNLSLPPIDPAPLFYTNASHLPADATTAIPNAPGMANNANSALAPSSPNVTRDPWRSNNLSGVSGSLTGATDTSGGATREYTVARGDNLGKIAAANGTTLAALRKANPNVDPTKLRPGMKLQIPASGGADSQVSKMAAGTSGTAGTMSPEGTGSAMAGDTYTVKPGDTLTKVAKAHGVTVSQLRAANNLKTSGLKSGQKLKLPAPGTSTGTNELTAPVKHTKTRAGTNTTHTATP